MKKLMVLFVAALAVLLLVPVVHAQSWVLNGNPVFTASPMSPDGGPNPFIDGGTYTVSTNSLSLTSRSVAVPNSSFVGHSASIYGSFTQKFTWQGMGPPTPRFTVHTDYSVNGSVSFPSFDHAKSYASPGGGGVSGDTNTANSPNPYGSSATTSFVVAADSPGSFTAKTIVNFGVYTLAHCPPSGPSHQADSSATGSLSL